MKRLLLLIIILIGVYLGWQTVQKNPLFLSTYFKNPSFALPTYSQPVKVATEESVTVDAVKRIGPSVVTVIEQAKPVDASQPTQIGPFSVFGISPQDPTQQSQPQSIGSGFIISSDGLVVTNKHVVGDTTGKYQIITANDKKYDVTKIYRDPLNDIAILKIEPSQNNGNTLVPVPLGDSSNLQVGQFAIAIGTALGEFRNTVTTGVISGLGRGIQAGDQFQGFVEKLDNVIQTSAPINPGNSGGPLVNSSAQVIGVNTAVAQSGQNIGFALPINVIKDSVTNFNQTGQFNRPFLGISQQFITQQLALLNNVPSGAYIQSISVGSPAEKAGIKPGDIIVSFDEKRLDEKDNSLISLIAHKKVGDTVVLSYWRDNQTTNTTVTLMSAPNQ